MNAYSISNAELTAAAFLVALFPLPLYNTEMWLMGSASLQSTSYVHIMSCDNNYRHTSDKHNVYDISHTKDTKEAFHGIS